MTSARRVRWPRARPLVNLLQSPAHRVVRVLEVTRSQWRVGARPQAWLGSPGMNLPHAS